MFWMWVIVGVLSVILLIVVAGVIVISVMYSQKQTTLSSSIASTSTSSGEVSSSGETSSSDSSSIETSSGAASSIVASSTTASSVVASSEAASSEVASSSVASSEVASSEVASSSIASSDVASSAVPTITRCGTILDNAVLFSLAAVFSQGIEADTNSCLISCENNVDCFAWKFTTSDGTCQLSNEYGTWVNSIITGVEFGYGITSSFQTSCAVPGFCSNVNYSLNLPAVAYSAGTGFNTVDTCQCACFADPQCRTFVWNTGTQCFLQNHYPNAGQFPANGTISGIVIPVSSV